MAGPILNINIFTKSTAHTLRAISVATFPPAFLFLLIHGIASHHVNPAIGIVPLFFSAAYSVLLLANEKQCGCQSAGLTGTPIHMLFDLLIGIGSLVCLILTWVYLPGGYDSNIMFGTYCSNFLILNVITHAYFIGKSLHDSLLPGSMQPVSCPQCQYGPFTGIFQQSGMRNGYAPLLGNDGQPRGSHDEAGLETAESAV